MWQCTPCNVAWPWSQGSTTGWLDKSYFSIAKDTMVAGREYKLTLSTRVAVGPGTYHLPRHPTPFEPSFLETHGIL